MSLWTWVGVAAVGGFGAVLRFIIDGAVSQIAPLGLPVGTLAVNVSGSFALGLMTSSLSGVPLLLAGPATVGSYTTFSTWMLETHRLGEEGERTFGLINVLISLALGLGAAALGRSLAHAL